MATLPHILVLAIAAALLFAPSLPAGAFVNSSPLRPTHEDRTTITYTPGPGDNTTVVRLVLVINNTTTNDLDITGLKDNGTGTYTYDLGSLAAGTTISYTVIAWNVSVGDGNISVASVVEMLWHQDLAGAKALAALLHRPMLVLFWSDDDRAHHELLTRTFDDERVLNLSASFVCVKIRVDDDLALADEWDVGLTPTIVFLDGSSKEVHRVTGNLTSDLLLAHMRFALGLGPRPVESPHGLLGDPMKHLLIMFFLMVAVLAIVALRARWWVRRP